MLNNPTTPMLIEDLGCLYPTEKSHKKARYGLYKCECGNEFKANSYHIKNGHTKSCGCYRKQRAVVHGMHNTRIYKIWQGIKSRTTMNTNSPSYKDYGGRGIKVCQDWLISFKTFYIDMSDGYSDTLEIDRIDVNKGYCKDNCRWATGATQSQNTRILKKTNTSGYRGVSLRSDNGKFRTLISVNGIIIRLGQYNSAIDAARAYNNYVIVNNLEHPLNIIL